MYKHSDFEIQSDHQVVDEDEGDVEEVVAFKEVTKGDIVETPHITDDIVTSLYTDEYEIGKFLQRPVLISSTAVSQGAVFSINDIRPWKLFFDTTTIKNKITNYAFIQCDLVIKVVVKCSPFIYGQYCLSYQPQTDFTESNTYVGGDEYLRIPLSQRQTIVIEPHKNKGGEMVLPFFHYKNWLELTSASQLESMGLLQLWDYAPLQSANGQSTNGCTINIYAYARNISLAGPTLEAPVQSEILDISQFELQSAMDKATPAVDLLTQNDKYGKGPISKVASSVASVSQKLEDVPILGPFAKVTSFGSKLIGGIASLFGFTNIPVIEDVRPFKDVPFHAFANADISVPMEKLCIDPKNELTIDPRTVGLPPQDELAIDYICKKKCFLTYYDWGQTEIKGDYFMGFNIGPTFNEYKSITGGQELYMVPMAMLASMFSNWRGEIVITLKLVKSQYHTGALQVCYDPVGSPFNNNDNSSEIQTKIFDISDNDEVQFRIPWCQAQSFLRCDPDMAGTGGNHSGFRKGLNLATQEYDTDYHNGRLVVKVFNPLTGPDSSAAVRVLAFVHGENMSFSNPSEQALDISDFVPQSEKREVDEQTIQSFTMGTSVPLPKNIFDVNFGEAYHSVRGIMRRTCKIFSEPTTNNGYTLPSEFEYILTKYPPSYGFDPNGRHVATDVATTGEANFNYTAVPPYNIVAPCFVGQRGSMNWHFNLNGESDGKKFSAVRKNDYPDPNLRLRSTQQIGTDGESVLFARQKDNSLATGASLINCETQTGLQIQFPQFNKFRFVSADPKYYARGRDLDDTENEKLQVSVFLRDPSNDNNMLDCYSEIGTDFNLFYFLNVPRRYIYTTRQPTPKALVWS